MSQDFNDNNCSFIIRLVKMIKELYEAELLLDEKILSTGINKKENFALFDKEWLDSWKNIVGYESIKEKCMNVKSEEDIKLILNEVSQVFDKLNTMQKLKELGEMDSSKLMKNKKKCTINEESNFIPLLSHKCVYFSSSIKAKFTINSEISKGIIFIHDLFPEKDKEQNLILLYKNLGKNKEFNKIIIKLEPKVNIRNVIKELKNKEIEEILNILNNKKYNYKIIEQEKKELGKEYEEKRKEEENKRKKGEEKKRIEENEKIKDNEMKIISIKQSDDKNEIKRLKDELEKYKIENEKLKKDLYKANKNIS